MEMILWLIVFVVLLVIEIATMGLTTIWFAGGALASFLAAYFGASVVVQVLLFLVVSVLLLVLTRPIAVRFFNQEREKTNADSLIGKKALIKERVDPVLGTGKAEVNGMEWSVKTEGTDVIEPGSLVLIRGIEGVKLVVEKEEE